MKKIIAILLLGSLQWCEAQVTNPGQVVSNAATNHVNNDVNSATESSLNKLESGIKGLFKKKAKPNNAADSAKAAAAAANLKDSLALAKAKYDSLAATLKTMQADTAGRMNSVAGARGRQRISVSPADSAAAINSFKTGSGGNGLIYQYLLTTTTNMKQKESTIRDTMTTIVTDDGNSRNDMSMFTSKVQNIGHANSPKYSIQLYPDNKTYSLHIIDTAELNSADMQNYQVTKVGNETVNGYYCTHSKLTIQMGHGNNSNNKDAVTEDIWTSTDVPGYAMIKNMMTLKNVTPKMMQAIEQAGGAGSFVKMEMHNSYVSISMTLITAEHRSFPASLFQIPPDYVKATNSNMLHQMQ